MKRTTLVLWSACLALCASESLATPLDDVLARRCAADERLLPATRAALDDPHSFEAMTLRSLAERAGVPAPAVHAVVLRGSDPDALSQAIDAWLRDHAVSTSLSRCAWSRRDDLVAVALVPRVVAFERLPPTEAGARAWRFALTPETARPRLMITAPDGRVRQVEVTPDGQARTPPDGPGTYAMQLMADLPTGPSPVAVWHEEVAGGGASRDAPAETSAMSASAQVLIALNALRREAGLPALRRNPLLDRVALEYAQRIASRRTVAHTPDPGDSPLERLAAAHVSAERVAENIARAPELALAHARLVASPSHRANMLDAHLDAVGFGVARSSGSVYLVELFATRPSLRSDGADAR